MYLKIVKLSKVFWGEFAHTTCYLINKAPLGPLNFKVIENAWTGKDVSYSHLRVFKCKHLCMFPKNKDPNLMIRWFHMSLFGMGMKSLDSGCEIQPRRN